MFKSLYRLQEHPERKLAEAILNWKGVLVMLLLFISEQFIALGMSYAIGYLNANFGTNMGLEELNLFTELTVLALMVFFFGRFYWINLRNIFKDFKAVYIGAPILCFIGAYLGEIIVNMVLMMIRGNAGQTSNNEVVIEMLGKQPLMMVVMTVILAPIVEESIFRAALARPLTSKKNVLCKILGYVISASLFALLHVYQYAFFVYDEAGAITGLTFNLDEFLSILVYIPMGIGFVICADFCKNFWGSVACHMITNGAAVAMLLLLSLLQSYGIDTGVVLLPWLR